MKLNNVIAFSIMIFAFAAWGICFGYHFGWLDDVQDLNIMKGPFVNGCVLFDPVAFTIIQNVLQGLYRQLPKFPWFGSLLYIMLAYSLYSSVRLLITQLQIESIKMKISVALLFVAV